MGWASTLGYPHQPVPYFTWTDQFANPTYDKTNKYDAIIQSSLHFKDRLHWLIYDVGWENFLNVSPMVWFHSFSNTIHLYI